MDGDDRDRGEGLFRPEAVAEQQERWLGTVLLVPKVSHTIWTGLAALVVGAILAVFAFGEYTRKARIGGWLASDQGLIVVVAPQSGVLTRLEAREGMDVAAGATLAVLSAEQRSETLGATRDAVVRHLRIQRDSLEDELSRHEALFAQQAEALEARHALVDAEARDLEHEIDLQRERLALAERDTDRQHELRERDIAIEQNLLDAERDALDQAVALGALARSRTELDRTQLDLDSERAELPLRAAMQRADTDRAIAALDQAIAQAEADRGIVITAPEAGTVTGLRAVPGSSVGPDAPLLTIVPAGARLEAQLYGPSRAIGFVRPGQRVRLRYQAFPHQKFGQYDGIVRGVSRSTVASAELAGAGALPGLEPGEPVYRVTVELAGQTATAYGEAVPLQPGMQLEADVLIQSRRLYQWVLDPLKALAGDRA